MNKSFVLRHIFSRRLFANKLLCPETVQVCCRTSSTDDHDDMEHLLKNPYFSNYAEKVKKLQETDPGVFQEKLAELEKLYQKTQPETPGDHENQSEKFSHDYQANPKTLDSILKLDLIKDKTPEEIETIWKDYHKTKNSVFAIISSPEYEAMQSHAAEHPCFLYAIPRGGGYEFFFQQFRGHSCHFTPVMAYQTHGDKAPLCLTLDHYTDIQEDKGIVLMRGEPDTSVISPYEAQLLALQTKMYYGLHAALKFNLVRLFNNDPSQFKHMDLVREFENYKRDYRDHKENVQ